MLEGLGSRSVLEFGASEDLRTVKELLKSERHP